MDVPARNTDCALVCFLARHPKAPSGDEVAAVTKVGFEIGCNTTSIISCHARARESENLCLVNHRGTG
jgi:hypothetical protein